MIACGCCLYSWYINREMNHIIIFLFNIHDSVFSILVWGLKISARFDYGHWKSSKDQSHGFSKWVKNSF